MWKCPKCGREFKSQGQNHSCVDKPASAQAYFDSCAPEARQDMEHIRELIKTAIPAAEEVISWGMPTYKLKKIVIQFAAAQKHIGIFPGPDAVEAFRDKYPEYDTSKGTIRIPYGRVDDAMVTELALWCADHRK